MVEKRDLDIVTVILRRVAEVMPGVSDDLVHQVEDEVRSEYGGQRLFIPKKSKSRTDAQRKEIFKDGLSSMPTSEIAKKYRISSRTLYRLMKTGGRFG